MGHPKNHPAPQKPCSNSKLLDSAGALLPAPAFESMCASKFCGQEESEVAGEGRIKDLKKGEITKALLSGLEENRDCQFGLL